MTRFVSPSPGASVTICARGDAPSLPNAIMCSLRNDAPADVPATCIPSALRHRNTLATSVPPIIVLNLELAAAGEKGPVGISQQIEPVAPVAVGAARDRQYDMLAHAQLS